MSDIAIAADRISKHFVHHSERATSLKERIVRRGRTGAEEFYALRDISLEIKHGESVGLMGANGSGKSTLLKVLAGILRPSTGTVTTHGRIASLLELGAGFNGELSGRDNIYLNASLLGLTRRETDGLFDEIVQFSELEDFIYGPVKHYSSGMYVRLGFAVAVHVDPEILLIDEVLAVGDEHFQRKCLDRIAAFQEEGRTILFVSHSSALVEKICSRAVVLDHGKQMFDGDPYFAAAELSRILGTDIPSELPDQVPGDGLHLGPVVFSDTAGGPAREEFTPGAPVAIRIRATLGEHWFEQVDSIQVVVMGVGDIPVWTMAATKEDLPDGPGEWIVDFVVPSCPPLRGRFVVAMQLSRANGEPIAAARTQHAFGVLGRQTAGMVEVGYSVEPHRGSSA
ncbi:MAG: ABC transporter ATP-binding protein [Actinomycetota bacterium]|nr:ABC transporter ATP-binding protein [Actinomycetota bacterium]